MMELKKIIVDCDTGTDDAVALIILIAAHKKQQIEIKGITCVRGNTDVDNVVRNVFRILEICGTLDIPVYRGAHAALLNTESARIADAEIYHGADGLADVFTDKPDTSKLQAEHAVVALQKIVSENPGEISLVCMAPLTNIALAMKMNPGFANSLKELYIMGGNYSGKGNITAQAEFNFFADPESVHIVLDSVTKPVILLPWETCLTSEISLDWRHEVLGKIENPIVRFINAIETYTYPKTKPSPYKPCDGLLAAIVIRPEIVKLEQELHADIELHGIRTRGQVVLDHLLSRKPNVRIIMAYDSEIFQQVLLFAVQQS